MKITISFIILLIIVSCNSNFRYYDCYKNGFNTEQKESIDKLQWLFQDFLNSNYPEKENNVNQLREYCQDLIKYEGKIPNFKLDSDNQKQILDSYINTGLESEFRSLEYSNINQAGLHFNNLEVLAQSTACGLKPV